jgi:hypothetical protein
LDAGQPRPLPRTARSFGDSASLQKSHTRSEKRELWFRVNQRAWTTCQTLHVGRPTFRASASGPTAEANDRFLPAMGRQHDDHRMRVIGEYGVSCIAESESRFGVPTGCGRVVGRNRRIGFERLHTLRALASSEPASFEGVRLAAGCADPAGASAADTTDYGRIARMTSVKAARNLTP